MVFREFKEKDTVFCCKIRRSTFIEKCYDEIGAESVTAVVNVFMPEDYIRMSQETKNDG